MLVSADIIRLAFLREQPPPAVANQFITARITGESIAMTPTVTVSNELDPSGQVRDSILTGATTAGAANFEVSRNPWLDLILAAAACGNWGVGSYGGVAVTANQLIPSMLLHLFNIEKRFTMPDVPGPVYSFHRFPHSAISQATVSITPGAPITGTANVSGGPME